MHIIHFPRFWKHKESKEVIDHLTYSDLKEPHSSNFDECDVTGELLPTVTVEQVPEPVEVENSVTLPIEDTEGTVAPAENIEVSDPA